MNANEINARMLAESTDSPIELISLICDNLPDMLDDPETFSTDDIRDEIALIAQLARLISKD